ncbi:MAG: hypothetical protein ACRD0P_02045 [Stackebrandtia sp.]
MSDYGYAQGLYELRQLREGDLAANANARSQVEDASTRVEQLREAVEQTKAKLLNTANRLQTTVPDLRPEPADPVTTQAPFDLGAELAGGASKSQVADKHVVRSIREAQLAPLLPGAPAFVRNLVVYGAAMIACYVLQMLLRFVTPVDLVMWLSFVPPVLALLAGYVATGLAGTPRLPTHDDRGKEIEFTVKKSPRLGAALAVLTIAVFWFTTS